MRRHRDLISIVGNKMFVLPGLNKNEGKTVLEFSRGVHVLAVENPSGLGLHFICDCDNLLNRFLWQGIPEEGEECDVNGDEFKARIEAAIVYFKAQYGADCDCMHVRYIIPCINIQSHYRLTLNIYLGQLVT